MSSQIVPRARKSGIFSLKRPSTATKASSSSDYPAANGGERTVRKLRLSKAITISEGTSVSDACRRMAARHVDALIVTNAAGLLSGIVTDKDIAIRVVSEGLKPEQTIVSKIMTKNPVFVSSGTLAIEALHKMVEGKFRHLPVVENGEVMALLDITKCLYDAISRMEKAAERGSAIAAAIEGVERQWGSNASAQYALIETLRERMFKPSLSTIISDNTIFVTVSPSDPVYVAAKRMRDLRASSTVIVSGGKLQGILTPRDIVVRVVAQRLSPEVTLVEKVMTANPTYASLDTTILDALRILHDGQFLHIPVLDGEGVVVACLDVLQLTHAALSSVGGDGAMNGVADSMMQNFWESVLSLDPADNDHETNSQGSGYVALEGPSDETTAYPSLALGNTFTFKFKDRHGQVHRFSSGAEDLGELVSAVARRAGVDFAQIPPLLLYDDDEGDRVLLSDDADLAAAVQHARASGQKALRLYVDYPRINTPIAATAAVDSRRRPPSLRRSVLASATVMAGAALLVLYIRRSNR
ncbi:CBS domain-containing protein CBSCBSPB3-like [Wolffia australiana]